MKVAFGRSHHGFAFAGHCRSGDRDVFSMLPPKSGCHELRPLTAPTMDWFHVQTVVADGRLVNAVADHPTHQIIVMQKRQGDPWMDGWAVDGNLECLKAIQYS